MVRVAVDLAMRGFHLHIRALYAGETTNAIKGGQPQGVYDFACARDNRTPLQENR